ncbi:MAG TPA: hypothetical protein ENJ17_04100 [Gammaproteobacteria bacterium]|nr:hypothetical protein [Gammaproteobacteria bacterium]
MDRLTLLLVMIALLPACAGKQQLHAFPREAMRLMKAESCDCERIEFVEGSGDVAFRKGALQQKSTGHVQSEDGTRRNYELAKGALYVTEDTALPGTVAIEVGGGILTLGEPSQRRFSRVRQRLDLLNPFDGKRYVLAALYDGRDTQVHIRHRGRSEGPPLGFVVSADAGVIDGKNYTLSRLRTWHDASEERKAKGGTVWHRYPAGAYLVLSAGPGREIKLFQGAQTGKVLGMEAFVGEHSVAYLPRGMGVEERRQFFLFYHANEFRGELLEAIDILPDCLGVPADERMVECPSSVVME